MGRARDAELRSLRILRVALGADRTGRGRPPDDGRAAVRARSVLVSDEGAAGRASRHRCVSGKRRLGLERRTATARDRRPARLTDVVLGVTLRTGDEFHGAGSWSGIGSMAPEWIGRRVGDLDPMPSKRRFPRRLTSAIIAGSCMPTTEASASFRSGRRPNSRQDDPRAAIPFENSYLEGPGEEELE